MASFSNAQAVYGLTATASPAGTNVTGKNTVGIGATVVSLTSGTGAYSIKATAATTNNSFQFYPATGVATALSGSPTIADADGKDCEGVSIALSGNPFAVLFKSGAAASPIDFHTADPVLGTTFSLYPNEVRLISCTTFLGVSSSKTWTVTIPQASDWVTITVIGSK